MNECNAYFQLRTTKPELTSFLATNIQGKKLTLLQATWLRYCRTGIQIPCHLGPYSLCFVPLRKFFIRSIKFTKLKYIVQFTETQDTINRKQQGYKYHQETGRGETSTNQSMTQCFIFTKKLFCLFKKVFETRL